MSKKNRGYERAEDYASTVSSKVEVQQQVVFVAAEWAVIPGVYVTRRPCPRLNARQGAALRAVFDGMVFAGVKFNGRKIRAPHEAIMVLLDRVAEEIGLNDHGEAA